MDIGGPGLALLASAALLGLAGMPHCAAMCSAPCAAVTGPGSSSGVAGRNSRLWLFGLARIGSYAAAGAVAAGSVAALALWSQWSPALRPLWVLLHCAAFGLGLWLLWRGRQPAWLGSWGRVPALPLVATGTAGVQIVRLSGAVAVAGAGGGAGGSAGLLRRGSGWSTAHWRAAASGLLWAAWPCGLLQSALLVAAMNNGAIGGAATMAVFALVSTPALVLGPWAWRRWLAGPSAAQRERVAVRAAGAMLAAASAWALGHGLWDRIAAFCAAW